MLTINPTLYERLAEFLVEEIDGRSYYSDIITLEDSEADYTFSATLMIYYSVQSAIDGDRATIENLVPIWWEFYSVTEDGVVLNDFDVNILKQIVCR